MREKVLLLNQDVGFRKRFEAAFGKTDSVPSKQDRLKTLEWLEKTRHADLIDADICMPHLAVEDFLQFLRLHADFRHVSVRVLSGLAYLTEKRKYLGLGANNLGLMPFSVRLKNRVANLMHHKALCLSA